jgi:hypothetical protein
MSPTRSIQLQDASAQKLLNDYAIHSTSVPSSNSSPAAKCTSQGIIYFSPEHISQLVNVERQPADFDPSVAAHPTVPYAVSNPPHWTSWFREVPSYRPVNKELDRTERQQDAIVMLVGNLMLIGCSIIAVRSSTLAIS